MWTGLIRFSGDRRGSVIAIFAITLSVIVGVVIAALNISSAISQRSRAQDAIDSAALAAVRLFMDSAMTDEQVIQSARSFLTAASNVDPNIAASAISIDRAAKQITIDYDADALSSAKSTLWDGIIPVRAQTKARIGGSVIYPVCILITEMYDNHTLRASNDSKVDLNNCLVQVNTQNWDAVEAKDDAYIHINNGQNCYVGDIHFGDILPEKMPTCTLFADPFYSYSVPFPNNCDYTDFKISKKNPHSAPLQPGVYCGGIDIEQDATFSPGVYYVKDGPLEISGSQTDITAEGVTFLLVGEDTGVTIESGGKMTFTPAAKAAAGQFDGFVFFLDQSANIDPSAVSEITGADVDLVGAIYLNGQHLVIGKNADLDITQGSIVVSYLLPQGGDLDFTGSLPTASAAAAALQKALPGSTPVLVK